MRTRASFGSMPDRGYENVTKIPHLNTSGIIVINDLPNDFNIYLGKDYHYSPSFSVIQYFDSIFTLNTANSKIKVHLIPKNEIEGLDMKMDFWKGMLMNKDYANFLQNKYGIDYALVINGDSHGDFITRTSLRPGGQGLYRIGKRALVFSVLSAYIYNLKTGKLVKMGSTVQASADYSNVDGKKKMADYNSAELQIIEAGVKKRLVNNVSQLLPLIGLN